MKERVMSYILGSITSCQDNTEPWKVKLKMKNKQLTFEIDFGADTSLPNFQSTKGNGDLQPVLTPLFGPGEN